MTPLRPPGSLANQTLLITGASRGIGKAIALRAARDGARICVVGKTETPHPKLPGTLADTVREVQALGGQAIAAPADVRSEEQMVAAVQATVDAFGGIDIVVNNASAISLTGTLATDLKRFDLMQQVNARGSFLTSKLCLPWLLRSTNPHILMLSPPLTLEPEWFAPHLAYTLSKYGMSLCVLGLAEEFRSAQISVNALWPKTVIATAAVQNLLGGDALMARARRPEIVADAAHLLFSQPRGTITGQFLLVEEVLAAAGVHDLSSYSSAPDRDLAPDLFVDTE